MILLIILQLLFWVMNLIFDLLAIIFPFFGIFSVVTVLPFGAEDVLTTFVQIVHGLITVLPFMAIVWNMLLAAFVLRFSLWFIENFVKWFIERIH